jgi:hypothetical protein
LDKLATYTRTPSPLSLSLKAQEYLDSLKKSSIVVVKILMLYLYINNLWGVRGGLTAILQEQEGRTSPDKG